MNGTGCSNPKGLRTMATYKNMDICLPYLKDKMRTERDPARRTAIQIAINIIAALPAQEIQEGVVCRDCYWYVAEGHTCLHKNGIRGRVKPMMFCSYGSVGDNAHGEDEPTEDFSEFAEEEEE